MSLSKEQLTAAATELPRRPKCTRCRHHGIVVPQKGHMKFCPFVDCDCWKCYLIKQRTRLTALQRNLNRPQNKPQKKEQRAGASGVKPAGERTPEGSTAALMGDAPPLAPERPSLAEGWSSAAGGERVASLSLPANTAEEGPCSPFNPPYCSELGQAAPLPVIHLIHYPSSYASCRNILLGPPWLPSMPAGYNDGLRGPLTFPHFQQDGLHYSPEPGPPAISDYRQVFFTLQPTLPEPHQEELLMSKQPPQPPLPKHAEQNMEDL
ncbi:doublesex- and mab-3-related transcription factor 1-like [Scomber scombrus]|uniref:Doublesex- and mab-3-related transcription factor 1-like n=1 Tax=Scomber scombrus TaxID=13677 RepID=A0AAV1PIL6_SCOSC